MVLIKDPIHGFIEIPEWVEKLIDTPEMQRLRRIKQLGVANLVYPGANHTRFEHSLGSYHLADRVCRNLGITSEEVKAAALLHDISHGPLSHVTDEAIVEHGGLSHEEAASKLIYQPPFSEILGEKGLNLDVVRDLLFGKGRFGEIICSELDVDRMDYLARDAHYTGASYGVTDYERLIYQLILIEDELVVAEGGFEAAESLLVSRFLMQPTVYRHHVSRIAKSMLKQGLKICFQKNGLKPSEVRSMDEYKFFSKMEEVGGIPGEIVDRVKKRNLYKRAYWKSIEKPVENFLEKISREKEVFKKRIASAAGVDLHKVIIDLPFDWEMEEFSLSVEVEGSVKPLEEVSTVVSALKKARWENCMLGIYCPKEVVEDVSRETKKIIPDQ